MKKKTFVLYNKKTGKEIKKVKAEKSIDVIKKYDLCTRENNHIGIREIN